MATFSELLTTYINRAGITDSELARSIGVRRQTVFRWKEGVVARPRHRDDVMRCAERLRLSSEERDGLLMSAGFAPESSGSASAVGLSPEADASLGAGQSGTAASQQPETTAADSSTADESHASVQEPQGAASGDPKDLGDSGASSSEATDPRRRIWLVAALGAVLVVVATAVAYLPDLLTGITSVATSTPAGQGPPPLTSIPPTSITSTPTPATAPIVSAAGETLILIGEFANYSPDQGFNVAGRLLETLADEISAAELISTTAYIWPHVLSDQAAANRVLDGSHAAMLIWGEYDSGRVRVNLSTAGSSTDWEKLLPSPAELSTTINFEAPHEVRSLAVLTLGTLYREKGDTVNARGAFRRVLELQPGADDTVATTKFYLATVLAAPPNPDYPAAVSFYDDVVRRRPDWVNARYNRGTAYLKQFYQPEGTAEELDAAIADLTWVVEKRPTYADAYLNRGIAYYERNIADDIDRAIADLDHAVELSSGDNRAVFNRGLARLRRGDENWSSDFDEILAVDQESANAHNALCWGYALGRQSERALAHCDRAIELGLTDTVYDGRGIALAQLGQNDEAIDDLTAYLETLLAQPSAAYVRQRGPLVEEWIAELEAGENPFSEDTLEGLR